MRGVTYRPFEPEDLAGVAACYRAAFPASPERTLDEWRWRLVDPPRTVRAHVAVADGDVVALYAGLARRTRAYGEDHDFVEVIDSMVHPSRRAGLARRGLFAELGEQFFDLHGGAGGVPLFYGWPTEANRRIGQRLLSYERLATQLALVRDVAPGPEKAEAAFAVERIEHPGEEVRWLYERVVDAWGAGAKRDEAALEWRYVARPGIRYELLGARARAGGPLEAFAVGRPVDLGAGPQWAVCEWLADDDGAADALLDALERAAAAAGARSLVAFLPDWSRDFARFQESGFRVFPTPWDLVARTFERRFDGCFLRERWWFTLGDTDLV